ncbi:uncharacterized protein N7479_007589 [Penicillium vulpinum]|uniref:Uncharacterized protein n=1 Tax=Penicillium vulpinum TaxID=29845 RepID=A0A1V6S9Q1_9EURO|nr:uncharacterized protein N7479_007589 [Penicillium vulpinum]KAJ5960439.1 hypothetical protein N7479_007589 [Penicillium vulpinum]OQE10757.1 hypothetical protein PENVUL_c003G08004 [Penicillium vulpinum]
MFYNKQIRFFLIQAALIPSIFLAVYKHNPAAFEWLRDIDIARHLLNEYAVYGTAAGHYSSMINGLFETVIASTEDEAWSPTHQSNVLNSLCDQFLRSIPDGVSQ